MQTLPCRAAAYAAAKASTCRLTCFAPRDRPPIAHRSHVARRMRLPVLISLPVAHTLSAVRCNAGAVIGVKFPNLLFPTPEDTNKNDACTKRRRRFLFTVHFPALSRRALIFSLLNMQNAVISRIRRSKAGDQFSI